MLEKLDKVSLYIAVVIIGYLTYSITEKSSLGIEAEEKLPEITKFQKANTSHLLKAFNLERKVQEKQ